MLPGANEMGSFGAGEMVTHVAGGWHTLVGGTFGAEELRYFRHFDYTRKLRLWTDS